MAVKVFFYTLRPYDEQGILEDLAKQRGIEYGYTEAYPTMENAQLAAGYDAVSLTPCDMSAPMLQRFHDLGVKAVCCRSIGYDHVDLEKARELGMKVSNVDYPPNGVANFAIMLMLMSLRKAGHILKRGEVQDYSLKGKIGRDISNCTVGVIGTGRIGQTVLKHLSGFGCELLAYDLYQNDEVKKIAKYVPLETLLAESDVITLHISVGCLGKSEVYADVEITVAVCGVFETVFDSLLISGAKGFVGNTVGDCGAAFGIAYPAVDAKAVGGFGTEGYSAPVKRQNIGVGVSAGNGSVGTGGDVAVYAVTGSAYRFLT